MTERLRIAVLAVLTLSSASALAATDVKIGTVDMQRALQSVESGKKAKAQLEKEFNAKKKELETEQNSIAKASEEFKKQSLVMSDEARARKQGELQDRIMKFQQLTATSQVEIQKKERELFQPIFNKLKTIIAETARKSDYTVVLEKNENNVLYSQEKDDITNEVISAYDREMKKGKTTGSLSMDTHQKLASRLN